MLPSRSYSSTMSAADYEFDTFEAADAGASLTYPVEAGALKVGGYVCIAGHACKITEIDTAQPGKHGHAKASIWAYDLFNPSRKREDGAPVAHMMEVPFVASRWYYVMDIGARGELSLMGDDGETRQDLDLPADDERLGEKVRALFSSGKAVHVQVLKAMGTEKVMAFKEECGK